MTELLKPTTKTVGECVISTYNSLGGGMVFSKKYIRAIESAPSPITIFRTVTVKTNSMDDAVACYANYIFEDIAGVNSTEDDFNICTCIEVDSVAIADGNEIKKKNKYTIEEIAQNREKFIEELKEAAMGHQKIKLKMIAKIPNPDTIFEKVGGKEVNPVKMEPLDENNSVFIAYDKYYGLHWADGVGGRMSLWHVPCIAYLEGCFLDKDTFADYMRYYEEYIKPGSAPKPKEYLELKCAKIARAQEKGNTIKTIWNMLSLMLLEPDSTRKQFLPSIFHALSNSATQFYALSKPNQSLKFLVIAYHSTKNEIFKKSAEVMFKKYKDLIRAYCARGFSAEIICFRPFIETLLISLSRNSRKELEFNNSTLAILDILCAASVCIGTSIITELFKMNKTLEDTTNFILAKMGKANAGPVVTLSVLLEQKRPQLVVNILGEVAKNARTKTYPVGKEEEYILMQYFVDTDVYENLTLMIREMMFGPCYPNLLAILEYRLQSLTTKYSVWELPDEDILKANYKKPQSSGKKSTMYTILTSDMKTKSLPMCMGFQNILSISSVDDVAEFRKSFAKYDIPASLLVLKGDKQLKAIFSVCGICILNAAHRTKCIGNYWDVTYDLVLNSGNIDLGKDILTDVQLKYLKFLANDAIVSGIFSTEDNIVPIVSALDLEIPENYEKAKTALITQHSDRISYFYNFAYKIALISICI